MKDIWNQMQKKKIITIISIILLVLGCSYIASSNILSKKSDKEITLSKAELKRFTEAFNADEYKGFLEKTFNKQDEIDWDVMLCSENGLVKEVTDDSEIRAYRRIKCKDRIPNVLYSVNKEALTDYIKKYTGRDECRDDTLTSWIYIDETDSFYSEHLASLKKTYTCTAGKRKGDHYVLRFQVNSDSDKHYGLFADRVISFTKSDEDFLMESNAIQWDDHCDKEHCYEVKLSRVQFNEPIKLITYPVELDDRVSIILTKNNCFLTELKMSCEKSSWKETRLINIIDVGFFDFDEDGVKDIIIIADSEFGKQVLLYSTGSLSTFIRRNEDSFDPEWIIDENTMSKIGGDFTVESMKNIFSGIDGVYSSYEECYTAIAKKYYFDIDWNYWKYNLIYADDDDIPELVVDYPGFFMSLYTYENGHARCLMNHWGYGMGGNPGYQYAPGKGIYHAEDGSMSGSYEEYMSKRDKGELVPDYELEDAEKYRNCTEKEMTDEEIIAEVNKIKKYRFEQIEGTMRFEELMGSLNGAED